MVTLSLALLALSASHYRAQFPLPDLTVPSGWGVNIHFTDPQPGEMEKLKASGLKWVRMDFVWAATEREKGKYDFAAYDRLMAALDQHGMRALFILDYGNDLYENGSPRSPEARAAFCRWVEAALKRYRGRGIVWEMWNEPNIFFWQPRPNVEEYIRLATEVGETVRRTAPDEWYVGPATSGFDWTFLERCFAAGLLKHFDAVTIHPYRQQAPETVLPDWTRLRGLVARHAPKGKKIPLISGEWGYSAVWQGYDVVRQGKYAARQYLTNLSAGVGLSIWYDWKNDGTDPKEPEHHFGSLKHDLADKPAHIAMRDLTQALAGYRYVATLHGPPDVRMAVFQRGRQWRAAVWTVDGKEPLVVTGPTGDFTVTSAPKVVDLRDGALFERLVRMPVPAEWRVESERAGQRILADFGLRSDEALSVGLAKGRRFEVPVAKGWTVPIQLIPARTLEAAFEPEAEGVRLDIIGPGGELQLGRKLTKQRTFGPLDAGKTVRLLVGGREAWSARVPRVAPVTLRSDALLAALDGDAKVGGSALLEPTQAGSKLVYTAEPGWKFVEVRLREPLAVPDDATSLVLRIRGEATPDSLRMRFVDSADQTFQPDAGAFLGGGWRTLRFPLNGAESGHWGGPADGIVRGKRRLTTLLLVDANADGGKGWIEIGPVWFLSGR